MSTSLARPSGASSRPPARQRRVPLNLWQRTCRAILETTLSHLQSGCLTLRTGDRVRTFGNPEDALSATIDVLDGSFYPAATFMGSIGAGRSYMQGAWVASDLTQVVQILSRNQEVLQRWSRGPAKAVAPLLRGAHALRRNTLAGSRRNIEAHYDLSNEFFEQFLDRSMMYSCAFFENEDSSLEEASEAKLERVCHKLDLRPDDHLLEIGTGWGGLALHAARNFGCRVTTTTISPEQHAYATARVRAAGLEDRITVLLHDYRDLEGQYDKLVSIEMIEAVGAEYLDTYMAACSRLLRPEGVLLLQAIVIEDHRYEQAARSVDFIKRYIFPGSFIPSVQRIDTARAASTDLRCVHAEDITPHYAETLRYWRQNFHSHSDAIAQLGFDEAFQRLWDFYFSYCEGGFRERRIGNVQFVLAKPQWTGTPPDYPSFEATRWPAS